MLLLVSKVIFLICVDINNNVLKNVVRPYIDSNIQKLVTSEEELIENIPNFINDLT